MVFGWQLNPGCLFPLCLLGNFRNDCQNLLAWFEKNLSYRILGWPSTKTFNPHREADGGYRNGLFQSTCQSITLSCPLHISWTLRKIFIKLRSNVPLSEKVCRTHNSATQTQGQFKGHGGLPLNFVCPPEPFQRFSLNFKYSFSETMCRTHDQATQTRGQGYTSRSCDLPFLLCSPYLLNPLDDLH